MQLMNSKEKFGLITKLLHWGIFILFCLQFFLVYRREFLPKDSAESTQYMLLHKSFGVIILCLALFFILWRQLGSRPIWPSNMTVWQRRLAKGVHWSLFFVMFAMPLSGALMTQFHGYQVAVFGYNLPNLISENKALSSFFHEFHEILSYIIIGLVGIHILGALVHHFYYRDRVLKNML